jgi:hypothetical protein
MNSNDNNALETRMPDILPACLGGETCVELVDTKCVQYTGAGLPLLNINPNDRLDVILGKLGMLLQNATGTAPGIYNCTSTELGRSDENGSPGINTPSVYFIDCSSLQYGQQNVVKATVAGIYGIAITIPRTGEIPSVTWTSKAVGDILYSYNAVDIASGKTVILMYADDTIVHQRASDSAYLATYPAPILENTTIFHNTTENDFNLVNPNGNVIMSLPNKSARQIRTHTIIGSPGTWSLQSANPAFLYGISLMRNIDANNTWTDLNPLASGNYELSFINADNVNYSFCLYDYIPLIKY